MSAGPILLVEDSPGDAELTRRALQEARVLNKLLLASSGQEALDCLFGEGGGLKNGGCGAPVMVLLDLKLPGGPSGHEVLRRIRQDERTKFLPVVVLTHSGEEDDLLRSYGRGANAFVRKPVDFDRFVEAIKALGIFWSQWNEAPPAKGGK
jgi:two-component system, response regulator